MATAVIDLTNSGAKLEFSGSSDEDVAFAKTFWQSVQLFPPLESRLVSSDIHQRLRKAPPGTQSNNLIQHVIWCFTLSTNGKGLKVMDG